MELTNNRHMGLSFAISGSHTLRAIRALLILISFVGSNAYGAPPERANQEASSTTTANQANSNQANQEASSANQAYSNQANQTNQDASTEPSPPVRANQEASFKPFSTWDIQFLYGTKFREPGIIQNVAKGTVTLENSAAWSWGSSYFFIDYLKSDSTDQNATEFYSEWYPSASLSRISGADVSFCFVNDILLTLGFNAGAKTTGAAPFVILPGLTFNLKIPGFQFFSLGTYAFIDRGEINGHNTGNRSTTYQITPSWSLPFKVGFFHFRFDGFIDFIGRHRLAERQVVAQPTIKLDIGNFWCVPDRLFAGVEWNYMHNKFGIKGLNQTAAQAVVMWVF